ncbi:DUF262 domain-containing protein [Ureibacillus massiliensis]|uniref:DUF262 domain-containing protein n=1 Tax=Ureibacillus massiliensis TaxID=292806 RepID=UPI00068C9B39|nr:DUF262 domain-containing protein [Ureibacillus massiliensis]
MEIGKIDIINEVNVEVSTLERFFKLKSAYPIGIDTYQRPYVWNVEKVKELINDLIDHLDSQPNIPYYMGNILLHQNDKRKKLFIIDGQQRITTLSIIYYMLNGNLIDEKIAIEFDSPISIKNIKNIQMYLNQHDNWKEKVSLMFPKIQFTFITTFLEDLAFTFFDTQNYRGVKLEPTDLLKAYHLRGIDDIKVQENCAKSWESIQSYESIIGRKGKFINELFNKYLWRARCWRGQKHIRIENDEDILNEFMRNTKLKNDDYAIQLYPNFNNSYGIELKIEDSENYKVQVKNENYQGDHKLPFTIRQPISKGLGYFLYSKKYSEVIHLLFTDKNIHSIEIKRFRIFYNSVWKNTSQYLKELFIIATIMYYDKFGEKELFRFSLWLDHVFGAIRLNKQNVVKQAPLIFLTEEDNNLLDVISQAFIPEEVFEFLKFCSKKIDIYQSEQIEAGKGVRGEYKFRILNYYSKDSFENKESWMDQLVEENNNANKI